MTNGAALHAILRATWKLCRVSVWEQYFRNRIRFHFFKIARNCFRGDTLTARIVAIFRTAKVSVNNAQIYGQKNLCFDDYNNLLGTIIMWV